MRPISPAELRDAIERASLLSIHGQPTVTKPWRAIPNDDLEAILTAAREWLRLNE